MDAQAELTKLAGFEFKRKLDGLFVGEHEVSINSNYIEQLWNISLTLLRENKEAERKGYSLRAANLEREKEWNPDNAITLAYRGNELAGEVGEACNVIKKLERERIGIRGTRATKEMLSEELADVVICADLIAMHSGIDLDEAVRDKFNATSEKYGLQTRINSLKPKEATP